MAEKFQTAGMSGVGIEHYPPSGSPRQIDSSINLPDKFSLTPSLSHPMGEGVRQDG
jgi:hypothetical protein